LEQFCRSVRALNNSSWLERHAEYDDFSVPERIEAEFRRYLTCGILACGFIRARCGACGHDFLLAFSCKTRGLCPSCATRRMAETAAHLVDHVFPRAPVRQWVLSLPKRLRPYLHYDPTLAGAVLRIFLSEIERSLQTNVTEGWAGAFGHSIGHGCCLVIPSNALVWDVHSGWAMAD